MFYRNTAFFFKSCIKVNLHLVFNLHFVLIRLFRGKKKHLNLKFDLDRWLLVF